MSNLTEVWLLVADRWDGVGGAHQTVEAVFEDQEEAESAARKENLGEQVNKSWDSPRFSAEGPVKVVRKARS